MEIDSPERLGTALRARRRALGLTQQDLADVSGVSVRFLSDLENGKPSVELAKVLVVAEALGYRLGIDLREVSS